MEFVPANEQGLIALFFANIHKTEFELVSIRTAFPDAVLRLGNIDYCVEFEYVSSNFVLHGHDAALCDLVICWKNDRKIDLPVIELIDPEWYMFNEILIDSHISAVKKQAVLINKLREENGTLKRQVSLLRKDFSLIEVGVPDDYNGALTGQGLSKHQKFSILLSWCKEINRLPSASEIAETWGVSRATAYNYIKLLKKEVRAIRGFGK